MGKKILLADDSITIQKVIELTFSDEDFEVVTVGNGRLAVEKVQDVRPDLVLCDIIMPEKDGYEVCDFVKKTPSLAHIPVLLLTGAFEPFDQDRATRVGCDGFLAKPFEPQTLIAKVKDLLNQASTRGSRAATPAAAPAPAVPARSAPSPVTETMGGPPAYDATSASDYHEPSFIPDEPLEETPTMITPSRFEVGRSVYDEPPIAPSSPEPAATEDLPLVDELPEPDELMDVSSEESATLQGEEAPEPVTGDGGPQWSQQTLHVPLETRAQAGVESAAADATFDEVFEDETPEPPAARAAPPSADEDFEPSLPAAAVPPPAQEGFGWGAPPEEPPAPPAMSATRPPTSSTKAFRAIDGPPPAPERHVREPLEMSPPEPPPPVVAPPPAEASFAAVAHLEPPPVASVAAEVGVPADMVEKIAQRVVAQVSEKVIREIAWEVIPDLAEALIKKEIDRLKAELQQIS
jgi:CheY-like chemotaxis protein